MISYRSFEHSSALQRAKRGTVKLRQPSANGCISQNIFFLKFRTQVAASLPLCRAAMSEHSVTTKG